MKKILVIDESALFRDFLARKLTEHGCEVSVAVNGLDGSVKVRQLVPDLVIMDYYLSRSSSLEVLEKLRQDPNTAAIAVIMASAKVDRKKLLQIARFGVRKFFTKPVRVDALFEAVSESLGVQVAMDRTPCIVEAHVNDGIVFVEVAQGLNKEKIELLRYKIRELLDLYDLSLVKVLVMISNFDIGSGDSIKLGILLNTVLQYARPRNVKLLTNSGFVARYIAGHEGMAEIEVTNSLEKAMEGLLGRRNGDRIDASQKSAQEQFLQVQAPAKDRGESIDMKFEAEKAQHFDLHDLDENLTIAVVDDDLVILELIKTAFADTAFTIRTFSDGRSFLNDPVVSTAALIFLDLMMPEMDGFQVLGELRTQRKDLPVIVLSALSQQETVVRALKLGVNSYMIKPLKPQAVRKKATEILKMNF